MKRDPTKKQSFSLEKDCVLSGISLHFWPFVIRYVTALELCTSFFQKITPSTFITTSTFSDLVTFAPPPRLFQPPRLLERKE